MSEPQGERAARAAAEAVARHNGRQAAQHLTRSAAVRLVGHAATRGLAALLFKAGGALGAKAIAIGALVLAAIVLLIGLLALVLSVIGAAFQSTTAVWPVPADVRPDGSYRAGGWAISSRFGWRQSPFTGRPEFHDGIDIVNPSGGCPFGHRCALPSMLDGVVTYVGWDQAGDGDPQATGGGQVVIVENGQADHRVLYAHLEPYRLYVQLQGKIVDDYGRYDEHADYGQIGQGELTPDLSDGDIEMWCALDMPAFRASRTGPGTVAFVYDRAAQCRTSVVWGEKGDGWEGWIADEPAADRDGRATLSWQTPIDGGKRAGDVALRFRAHLVPPPPPPTPVPISDVVQPGTGLTEPSPGSERDSTEGRTLAIAGQGSVGQGWGSTTPEQSRDGQPDRCERRGSGIRCVWHIATIASGREEVPAGGGEGRVTRQSLAVSQATTPEPTGAAAAPLLAVVSTASRTSVPTGGRFSVAVSIFHGGAAAAIPVTISADGAMAVLDASATSGVCSFQGLAARCAPTSGASAPATITVVFEVLPGNQARAQLTVRASASDGTRSAADQVIIEVAGYAVTPGPWPPPTQPPPPTWTPLPTGEPAWPTADPQATPLPTAAPTAVPPGQGPGSGPLSCASQALVQLPGAVNASGRTDNVRLIAPAAAAFQEARMEIAAQTGRDPLARLADALRAPEFRSDKPGVARMSWHMTGRAIDLDTGTPWRRVREGRSWRLYLGGADITAVFERHGFTRIPDRDDSTEWWHYEYRADGIAWASAMLQVWPVARLQQAFPEIAWTSVGCQGGGPVITEPLADGTLRCVAGSPSYASAVEELDGCGPPVRAGDRVYQLDSTLGFVGMTGSTTGPHLHLGLQVKSYDGAYHQTDICAPDWLQGLAPPPDAWCWTEMADPLSFLPIAPPPESAAATRPDSTGTPVIPEGAPWQLPPPDYPRSLLAEPAPGAPPEGQYWSPYQDGGRYGGGGVAEWFQEVTCHTWAGFPWCPAR
ncbi:MAG: hypothetical protein RLZZ387_3865 [Chloroflexota bacterium]